MRLSEVLSLILGNTRHMYYDHLASLKLADIMVPLTNAIKRSEEIEQCDYFHLEFRYLGLDSNGSIVEKSVNEKTDLYSVDYNYESPICPDYVSIEPHDLNQEIIQDWVNAINSRVFPIIQNAVSKDSVATFDADPDTCAFLHMFSGIIDTFNPNELDDYVTIQFDESLEDIMRYAKFSDLITKSEYRNTLVGFLHMTENGDARLLSYQLKLNGDVSYDTFPTGCPEVVATMWSEYILNMIKRKAKVIMVP